MVRNSTIVFVGVVLLAVGGGLVFTGLVDRGTFTFSGSEDESLDDSPEADTTPEESDEDQRDEETRGDESSEGEESTDRDNGEGGEAQIDLSLPDQTEENPAAELPTHRQEELEEFADELDERTAISIAASNPLTKTYDFENRSIAAEDETAEVENVTEGGLRVFITEDAIEEAAGEYQAEVPALTLPEGVQQTAQTEREPPGAVEVWLVEDTAFQGVDADEFDVRDMSEGSLLWAVEIQPDRKYPLSGDDYSPGEIDPALFEESLINRMWLADHYRYENASQSLPFQAVVTEQRDVTVAYAHWAAVSLNETEAFEEQPEWGMVDESGSVTGVENATEPEAEMERVEKNVSAEETMALSVDKDLSDVTVTGGILAYASLVELDPYERGNHPEALTMAHDDGEVVSIHLSSIEAYLTGNLTMAEVGEIAGLPNFEPADGDREVEEES